MSEADIPWKRRRVHRLTVVTWSSRTAKAAKGAAIRKVKSDGQVTEAAVKSAAWRGLLLLTDG